MTERARKILEEARSLPPDEKEMVLRELLADAAGDSDREAEEAWAKEISARIAATRAGEPDAGDWETVCNEIEAELWRR